MYLEHFGFSESPFSLTPNLRFFCGLTSYKEALDAIMVGLQAGEGFIKITGEVGTGKTLLCRKLLNSLSSEYITVYLFNSTLDIFNLQKAIAQELDISLPQNIGNHTLIKRITDKLITLHQEGKRVVIIVDEAQALTDQTLEGLRLLSNLERESSKLMQIILVGQPELNKKLNQPHLHQLTQRIVFSYSLPTLRSHEELLAYLSFRLAAAGYHDPCQTLIAPQALKLLFKASKGVPRLINILCHKAFLIAYGYNKNKVETNTMKMAIANTESINQSTITIACNYLLKGILASTLLLITIGVGSQLLSFTI